MAEIFKEHLRNISRETLGKALYYDRTPEGDWDQLTEIQRMSYEGNAAAVLGAAIAEAEKPTLDDLTGQGRR